MGKMKEIFLELQIREVQEEREYFELLQEWEFEEYLRLNEPKEPQNEPSFNANLQG